SETGQLGLELTPAVLSCAQGLGDLIIPSPHARGLFSLGAVPRASSDGFGFPLVPAVSHFRELAHDGASRVVSGAPRPRSGVQIGLNRHPEHKMSWDANTPLVSLTMGSFDI